MASKNSKSKKKQLATHVKAEAPITFEEAERLGFSDLKFSLDEAALVYILPHAHVPLPQNPG